MFLDGKGLNTGNDRTSLVGLQISACLLVALGCIFGFYVLFFGGLLIVSVVRYWQGHLPASDKPSWLLSPLLVVAITTALTYLCLRAAAALHNAQRWGAHVATGFGLMLLSFSGIFFYDCFHPDRQSPDEYFVILIVPFWIVIGLWWCIYLNLPHVRSHVKGVR